MAGGDSEHLHRVADVTVTTESRRQDCIMGTFISGSDTSIAPFQALSQEIVPDDGAVWDRFPIVVFSSETSV